MTLHLLRFDPDPVRVQRWSAAEGLVKADLSDDGYAWHALLCAVFGKAAAPKPFRVLARRGRPVQLLAYAAEPGDALLRTARDFADPAALAALGVETAASKPMPRFTEGRRLGFSVRVRPVVRTDREGSRDKVREVDALVHARGKGDARSPAEIYLEWTAARLRRAGVELEALRLDGQEDAAALRRDATRALRVVPGHGATAAGTLRIRDADLFAEALGRGIGRHRSFGFGMLLLSPPEA